MTQEVGGSTKFELQISGLKPGKHGFHVNKNGDITGSCKAAGPIFNPFNQAHGAPTSKVRKVGSLGNIEADKNGKVIINIEDSQAWLYDETAPEDPEAKDDSKNESSSSNSTTKDDSNASSDDKSTKSDDDKSDE